MDWVTCAVIGVGAHGPKSHIPVITNTFQRWATAGWIAFSAMKDPVLVLPAVAAIIGLIIFGFLALEVVFHLG
ncbi:hypothetical protein MTER_32250 [Mycolicibacter terrae]|uniref:Uncharacterized protein n=1 Tax=Mycolicibacter terrae TaxID=1788 RepID=A0AAD1HYN5_9MYCO|nr:hypothetical protein MTER_32250 [Mycolicibacter terrae]